MTLSELREFARQMAKENEDLKYEIHDAYDECRDAIHEGESEEWECEVAHQTITDLVSR